MAGPLLRANKALQNRNSNNIDNNNSEDDDDDDDDDNNNNKKETTLDLLVNTNYPQLWQGGFCR